MSCKNMSWQTIVKENKIDVSVINFKDLERERIDADFYSLSYLENEKKIKELNTEPLSDVCVIRSGTTPKDRDDYLTEGVILLKTTDIRNKPLSYGANYYSISEEIDKKMKSTQLQDADVLINIVGASLDVIGRVAIVPSGFPKANITQAMALIRSKDVNFTASYIFAFLLGKYGNLQAKRLARPTGQYNLNLQEVSAIRIPNADENLQKDIAKIIFKYQTQSEKSEQAYKEAERLLLKEINLEGYKGADEAISVRNFSEALADNRFDAEYWQPDYDVILETLSKYKKGVSTIGKEFKQLKGNFKAEKDNEYNYVEIGDVNVSTGEVEYNTIIGAELPANAKIKFGKQQLITSKVRPNRGATAILDNHEGYIGSGAFTVLAEQDNINLETLMVYLKASPIRELLLRYNTGTSYPVITDGDVLKLLIPLIDKTVQKKISELVSMSAKERQEAKVLLEKAKRAVEIFIEKDEEEALKYLRI
jgi:restriction endonuclease S subunit